MIDAVAEVRGTKYRKWVHWFGKDFERYPVGTRFYLESKTNEEMQATIDYLEAAYKDATNKLEALARTVMADQTGKG